MPADDALPAAAATAARRVIALEAENARLRRALTEAECGRGLLVQELQHRVRNMLAVVRSIARRMAQTSETAEDYALHLDGRLDALARAHAMLARDPDGGVRLDVLLAEELLAHTAHEGDRVGLCGPVVRLRGKAAEVFALAAHEMAVNAVKYGALCAPQGRLAVTWRVEAEAVEPARAGEGRFDPGRAGGVLRLEWRETGVGLPDVPPRRSGFGTEMIERTLAYELGAVASLGFGPDGACCTVVLPLMESVVAADSSS